MAGWQAAHDIITRTENLLWRCPPLSVCVIIVLGMAMVLTDRCFLVVVMMVGGSKHLNSFDLFVVTKDMWERAACDDNWLFCIL